MSCFGKTPLTISNDGLPKEEIEVLDEIINDTIRL
jgi:hypothetical protein